MVEHRGLTEWKPLKLILNFGLPILFGFFQQFYNIADTAIVGRILGSASLILADMFLISAYFLC